MQIENTPEFSFRGVRLQLVSDVGQQGDLTGALDGGGQVTLVSGAGTGGTAGQDLAALGQVKAELCSVLRVDNCHLVNAEITYLLGLAGTPTLFVSYGITSFVSSCRQASFV